MMTPYLLRLERGLTSLLHGVLTWLSRQAPPPIRGLVDGDTRCLPLSG
jgi:hypothetical protein